MSWLDRLKSHRAQKADAAEPTKPGSVGFVALELGAPNNSSPPILQPRLCAAEPANAASLQPANDRVCADCLHLLPYGTCGEPVHAGLMPGFGIAWPPEGYATGCAAFDGKASAVKPDRPYRLTTEGADRCHTPCWDDSEISHLQRRHARFIRRGIADQDADDLAERLTLRDRDGDDRRMCLECRELGLSGRCGAAARGILPGVDRQLHPVQDLLMRCPGFTSLP